MKKIIAILMCLFFLAGCSTNMEKKVIKEFKEKNSKLYHKIRYRTLFIVPFLLIKPLRVLAVKIGYKKIIKKQTASVSLFQKHWLFC